MAPLFTNNSCGFYTSEASPCQLGNYARYAIAVEEAADIVAGVKFAAAMNVRLTVKNTGHEYVYTSSSVSLADRTRPPRSGR